MIIASAASKEIGSDGGAILGTLTSYKINRHYICKLVPLPKDGLAVASGSLAEQEGSDRRVVTVPCSPAQIGSTSANLTSRYTFVDPEDGCSDIDTDLKGTIAVIRRWGDDQDMYIQTPHLFQV